MCEIQMVIGSWGSYNACNERAIGSKWLSLADYEDWSEIEKELKKEGFKLKGIDEELFIQDIEGFNTDGINCDYTHPKEIFELLKEAEVLDNDYKYELMQAYLDVRNFDDFEELVNNKGSRWDDDIHIYKGYDWEDYGRMIYGEMCYQVPEVIENFIDFEAYGKYMGDCYCEEYSDGIIEIC